MSDKDQKAKAKKASEEVEDAAAPSEPRVVTGEAHVVLEVTDEEVVGNAPEQED